MIYLAQTDTTAGFLSKDLKKLNALKKRPLNQPCLITTAKFSELKEFVRVPNKFKNRLRKAKKTSFIFPNSRALRVVKEGLHARFLEKNGWFYSSSANLHGQKFDEKLARSLADKVLDEELFEAKPSSIFKLFRTKIKKMR
ncbi:Sua5 YciO YrdC YwlC family protein [Campylobacter sp. MIT 99-7217]|uniref:Sua5/YciO/YrdC/YwlC family protein n=1 Tax=Campylobacter sp. MIT 99-7217 TaxID=535091 RepID=UPI00115C39EE|nr:Sua5/YciO/YrdC/YwlC family protein [Campylobacter sp. MIT 99-7217]TQR32367.1 Sua5 YciO YrdC YwlC family protein [Campylobacter sp. MIT 99-7217]